MLRCVFTVEVLLILQGSVNSASLGNSCTVKNKVGSCQLIKNCPEVKLAYERHYENPQYCNRKERTVCCPNTEPVVKRPVVNTISSQSELFKPDLLIQIKIMVKRMVLNVYEK